MLIVIIAVANAPLLATVSICSAVNLPSFVSLSYTWLYVSVAVSTASAAPSTPRNVANPSFFATASPHAALEATVTALPANHAPAIGSSVKASLPIMDRTPKGFLTAETIAAIGLSHPSALLTAVTVFFH